MTKMFLIILNLLAVLANTLMVNGECQCGIFLTDESGNLGTEEVYLSTTHPQACDRLELDQFCRDFCYQKFVNLTANGRLESISPVFNMSSGEMFCENLQQEVDHREVGGYYRWCQASWKFLGIKTKHSLCCTNSSFIRCEHEESQLATSTEPTQEVVATATSQSATNQTEVTQELPSNESNGSQNETSPRSSLKKRNIVEIIQVPRKLAGNSPGSSHEMLNKMTPSRSKRNASETAPDPLFAVLNSIAIEENDTEATEEDAVKSVATEKKESEEKKAWSPELSFTDWIPVQYLPNGMVEEVKKTRLKREMKRGQASPIAHLTSEILVATTGNGENAVKSALQDVERETDEEITLKWVATVRIDEQKMTTALPLSNDTKLDFWATQLNETDTEATKSGFVNFSEEKNSTQAW